MSLNIILDDFEKMVDKHRKKELLINNPLLLCKEYVDNAYRKSKRAIREEYIKLRYSLS